MKTLLIVLLVAVATLTACTTIDKALLTPATNDAGEALYANEDGDTITATERQALPEEERDAFTPVYEGPKDSSDFAFLDSVVPGLGGLAAGAAGVWFAMRRREKPKVAKKKS